MNFHKCKKKYMNTDAELITCNITIQKNTYHTCYSIQNPCITGKVLVGMHDLYICVFYALAVSFEFKPLVYIFLSFFKKYDCIYLIKSEC